MERGYRGFEWIFADFKTDCFVLILLAKTVREENNLKIEA